MNFTRADKGSAEKKQFLRSRKKIFLHCLAWPLQSPRKKCVSFFKGKVKKNQNLKNCLWGSQGLCREREYSKKAKFSTGKGPVAQWIECQSSGLKVASSNPGGRSCAGLSFHQIIKGKTMFQVPNSIQFWVDWKQPKHARKTICWNLKHCFSAQPGFIP